MENVVDTSNLKLFDRLLLPFKEFGGVFKASKTYGKVAMLIECILLGFGPLVLGQIEFGLFIPVIFYGLGFAFGFITNGFFTGALAISWLTYVVVGLILLAGIIALYYLTFSKTVNLVKELNKDEPIFNSIIFNALAKFFASIKGWFVEFSVQFKVGDKKVKTLLPLSFFTFGIPLIVFGETIKGLALLLVQLLAGLYLIARGVGDLVAFFSLGQTEDFERPIVFGVIALVVISLLVFFYIVSLGQTLKAARNYNEKRLGANFKKQLRDVVDKNFYITALVVPVIGAVTFTIIPLLFMIILAFTNRSNVVIDGYSSTAEMNKPPMMSVVCRMR